MLTGERKWTEGAGPSVVGAAMVQTEEGAARAGWVEVLGVERA